MSTRAFQMAVAFLPSGHFVTALPRNFKVIALTFAGLVTFSCKVPRSIAVLRSELSVCSNPCRKRTGSVSWIPTLIPFPDASGFSSTTGFTTLFIALLADCLADDRWLSTRVGRGPFMATEFLGLDLISPVAHDDLLLSSGEELEALVLLRDGLGDVGVLGC
jgi:hypothetical protein